MIFLWFSCDFPMVSEEFWYLLISFEIPSANQLHGGWKNILPEGLMELQMDHPYKRTLHKNTKQTASIKPVMANYGLSMIIMGYHGLSWMITLHIGHIFIFVQETPNSRLKLYQVAKFQVVRRLTKLWAYGLFSEEAKKVAPKGWETHEPKGGLNQTSSERRRKHMGCLP